MRTVSSFPGKFQHLWPERRQNPDRLCGRKNRSVRRLIHCIQIGSHRGEGLFITVSSQLLDQRDVADAKPKDESTSIGLGEGFLSGRHCEWIARVDVRNSRGDYDFLGCCQQQAGLSERFTSYGLTKLDGPEAKLFQFRSRFLHLGSRKVLELCRPDSNGPELYR
jgi:hypothetical protein